MASPCGLMSAAIGSFMWLGQQSLHGDQVTLRSALQSLHVVRGLHDSYILFQRTAARIVIQTGVCRRLVAQTGLQA